mmetsp:Transcript_28511/g.46208  ORF Transcript_28511/g.46208 Transcript_28511/m.46208 type:complete len:138 (-) Transcript_28511:560-973(-)
MRGEARDLRRRGRRARARKMGAAALTINSCSISSAVTSLRPARAFAVEACNIEKNIHFGHTLLDFPRSNLYGFFEAQISLNTQKMSARGVELFLHRPSWSSTKANNFAAAGQKLRRKLEPNTSTATRHDYCLSRKLI